MPRKKGYRKKNGKVPTKIKKYISRAISSSIEDKYRVDFAGDATAPAIISNTGGVLGCMGLLTGGGPTNRIGDKIRVKSIWLKGLLTGNPVAATQCHVRLLLVWDKTNNGGALSPANAILTDLLQGGGTANVATAGTFLTYDVNKVPSRYGIVYDRTFDLQITAHDAVALAYPMVKHFGFKKRYKKGIRVQYNAFNTGLNQDIQNNALYFIFLSDIAIPAAQPLLQSTVRVMYEDA